ncbi:protease Do subfamily [Verrucomicrobiia bacterium DG1235]|nr:protease Do subfamily [Verrucomicrobiae bacterium DG1235]
MLQKATPSVVSVYTARIVKVANSGGSSAEDELLRRFFGIPTPQRDNRFEEPEERRVPQGVGSGVIVSNDGYIVTNNHVVVDQSGDDADEILVRLTDGRELEATIVGRDALTDVAILKVESEDLPVIAVADSDNIEVGDVVFAIGNPMGVGLTVTQGIVSATHRTIGIYGDDGYENFIQTDASINPGNSGGALIDTKGRLVGINSAILSRSGGNIGIGFAIPSNLAVNISHQLANQGEVRRGFLGVGISNLTPDMAEAFQIEELTGVLINDVEEDSAADAGSLKRGDVIIEMNGKKVESANDFRIKVGNTIPESEIELVVIRDGDRMTLNLKVGKSAGRFAASANELLDGVAVRELDDDLAEHYRIPDGVAGLVITAVEGNSPYSRNFSEGMVILEVNDVEVRSVHEAREKLHSGMNKLYMFSRGRTGYLAVRVD